MTESPLDRVLSNFVHRTGRYNFNTHRYVWFPIHDVLNSRQTRLIWRFFRWGPSSSIRLYISSFLFFILWNPLLSFPIFVKYYRINAIRPYTTKSTRRMSERHAVNGKRIFEARNCLYFNRAHGRSPELYFALCKQ